MILFPKIQLLSRIVIRFSMELGVIGAVAAGSHLCWAASWFAQVNQNTPLTLAVCGIELALLVGGFRLLALPYKHHIP